jgi:hypothetical protein
VRHALEKGSIGETAVDDDAGGQRQSVPTILNQGIIDNWPQDSFTADGMVPASCDEFQRTSYFASSGQVTRLEENYTYYQKHRDL